MDCLYKYNDDIDNAVATLRKGGIILYPTDTIWGIGCDATNSSAVRRIFAIKQRPDSKALITLVNNNQMLKKYVSAKFEPAFEKLIAKDEQRPTTVIYPKGRNVAPELLAEDGSIGIRIVRDGYAAKLCEVFDGAIVSTSANISGKQSPATFSEITETIINAVDYVALEGQKNNTPAHPSKIIKLSSSGDIIVLRD